MKQLLNNARVYFDGEVGIKCLKHLLILKISYKVNMKIIIHCKNISNNCIVLASKLTKRKLLAKVFRFLNLCFK